MAIPKTDASTDMRHMRAALGLASRVLGQVAPNPAVGCVIVGEGRVVGRGHTMPGGRPHAETEALRQAGEAARGATAYVTLEPCSHHGRTAPCADALIEAGISRVVVALTDPDPRVSGRGIARLRNAGVSVTENVLEAAAREINEGFLRRVTEGRPMVTLKLATTLDGMIAAFGGDSQWITGEEARRYGHLLRARHDAVLTGIGTVLADDPVLNCRIDGLDHASPVRIVLDSNLRTPLDSKLVRGAAQLPLWLVTTEAAARAHGRRFEAAGVDVLALEANEGGGIDVQAVLAALASRGITRVLAESGRAVAGSLLRADLVDRVAWFRAPAVMGGDGLTALESLGVVKVSALRRFHCVETVRLGQDVLETYRRTTY
ncbi:bifunctional diaminohydroxyphosphoribosylaminopyrimidine deaminase/5-amino-6-(5-phosphoribosylamino)uracil reductase RibD [Iodidimonas sp. SYSU 1G8]|uniref:bifunctional diaminohydroxyphosphoribosylaminopyrimidine deaminase/5-amino-6-(5-phosphoribosylamino)uracil reductase RibD n=1 Tax=Iodidimonas sp. SYSU 1G8 TaxID=3133967 RepID=UPI0031FE77B0